MIETDTLLQDRYLIEKQIGAGGMGAVYRAVDKRFDSYVAIKETFYQDDELGEAFEREARLLNSLIHPALPHVSDYFKENNGYFLVMQFIEGEDMSAALKRDGAFPVKDVMRWTKNLLDALDYLHSQKPPIIHRDIKPHNIKLTGRGDVFLLDFGLAKLNSEDTTGAISVFGYSRTYSPLEQIQGTGTDARSDIFAFGATAYHLLTGKPPVDVLARAAHIVAGKPDPLRLASEINPEVPRSVANILNSALALNPDQRFFSAKAMSQALDFALDDVSVPEEKQADQPTPAAAPSVNSAETESFPALEAFSNAGIENASPITAAASESNVADENLKSNLPALNAEKNRYSSAGAEASTIVAASRLKTSRLEIAAAVGALIVGIFAVLYLAAGTNSALKTDQIPLVEAAPIEATALPPETSSAETGALLESVGTKKSEPETASSGAEIQKEADVSTIEAETVKKPKNAAPPAAPNSRTTATANLPRRSNSLSSGETRSRVVEQKKAVSDIESIFTGEPNDARQKTNQRQERFRRQEMSDQEFEDLRRERQQKRRERRNRRQSPPF